MDRLKDYALRLWISGGGLGTAILELRTSSCELCRMGQPRSRRSFLRVSAAAGGLAVLAPAMWSGTGGRVAVDPEQPLIVAPADPADWPAWREALARWRRESRARLAYDDALYRRPEFAWAARCFCCCFLMAGDEAFYDRTAGRYRVAEFLAHGVREFGGYDAVVLWHAYPRIGVDDRNQFDFYRELPGGLPGVRDVVRAFQARGVRVFLDYNPWDTGTRREGMDDLEVLARLVEVLEADGIFLDTMDRGGEAFRSRLDAVRPGAVLEGELALPVERVADHHLSWAQWFEDGPAPGVLRNKWFERRHLQHQIRRWDLDHTGELHTAWMNGSGMMVWENVFGSWVGWSPRDRSILRSMLPIQRRYADLFAGEGWTPLIPSLAKEIYVSLWEGRGLRLYTVVHRAAQSYEGDLFEIEYRPAERWLDLVAGGVPTLDVRERNRARLLGRIPARGIGAYLTGSDEALGEDWRAFLDQQRQVAMEESAVTVAEARATSLVPVKPTRRLRDAPRGMVVIPAAEVSMTVTMRVRECGFYESVPRAGHRLGSSYEYQIEKFERRVRLGRCAIDATPVTNAEYAEFLRRSGYRGGQGSNFLRHWKHGHPPSGQEDHPVVWISLDEARAYAHWAGKRLPTEEEWQYAAAGPEGRRYPWGDAMEPDCCNDGAGGGTTAVRAFPKGRSPFGVWDLCGNVWEWTESERTDGRTRFVMIKGGSWYRAKGSGWYFDGGPQENPYSAKFLMMGPDLDRCATVGFRCVLDLQG